MGIRQQLQNPMVGGGIAVVIIVFAVILAVINSQPDDGKKMIASRFYDLNTKQLFAGPRESDLPTDAPSGPLQGGDPADIGGKAGIKAWVYSCGECTEDEMFIGYLAYIPEKYWELNDPNDMEKYNAMREQLLIKEVDGAEWVLNRSDEGKALQAKALSKCKKVKPCNAVNE